MQAQFSTVRHSIDLLTWQRRRLFEFFRNFSEPFHGVCLRVDCTETYLYAKQHGLSVFLSFMHRSLLAAHGVESFRTRIADGSVWLYDQIDSGSAVGRLNGTIGFGHYPYTANLHDFVIQASAEVERVRGRDDLDRPQSPNLIRYSTLPWLDFTSISHARNFGADDSAPQITFGKMSEAGGRRSMPVSIHVHHGLVDGLHVAQFVDSFQKLLASPETTSV
jgi:chloramphenicol O-acetyltransferase type A